MNHTRTIKEFIIEEFLPDVGLDELDPDYDLLAGGVIDSLGLLKVISWLEERFELPIDDIRLYPGSFCSVAAISSFIEHATPDRIS